MRVSYVNDVKHLQAHIKYVSRKSALAYAYNFTPEKQADLFHFAYDKKAKRRNSRVAVRMFLALPDSWAYFPVSMLQEKAEKIANFLAEQLNIDNKSVMLFFHKRNEKDRNFHVHVVFKHETKDGKTLRLQPQDLRRLHEAWDKFLVELGYEPFKLKDYFPELGNVGRALNLPKYIYDNEQNPIATKTKEVRKELTAMAKDLATIQKRETLLHLQALYSPEDTIWIMAKKADDVVHRKVKVKDMEKMMSFLRYLNAQGYNIYATVNTFREDSKSRKEEEAESLQDKIYLDIDGDKLGKDGREVLEQILRETNLPKPTLAIRTSSKNYQAIWKLTQKAEFERLKAIMQELERRYGLDHTSDKARVFRLSGFNNKKRGSELVLIDRKLSSFKAYNLQELARFSHDERTQSVLREKREAQTQAQPQAKPEAQPKPQQQLKPETKPEPKPQQKPEPQQEPKPKPEAKPEQKQDQWEKLLTYRLILMREARELVGQSVHISYPSKLNDVATNLRDLETSTAKELLHHMSVQEAEEKMRQILAKYRPKLPENYLKELMLEAYQLLLEKIAEKNGIRTYLSPSAGKSYSEIEWSLAKDITREALYRFSTVEEAFEKAYAFFERIVQKHRPEKLEKSPNYAKLTMEKAFEEVLKEEQEQEEEQKQQHWRGPPRPGLQL